MKFIDTNILVYLVDRQSDYKREVAKKIIASSLRNPEDYLISSQTLAEFSNVCLRKFKMAPSVVMEYLGFFNALRSVSYDVATISRALEIKNEYQLQFYDSLLLATAEANGCDMFLSEDLNNGQFYCGMTAINPFGN